MTRLDWDRVRRERGLFAREIDPADDPRDGLWRSVGAPLRVPTAGGVVRWAVTRDGSSAAVQWRADDAAPVHVDFDIGLRVVTRLEDRGLLREHGESWVAEIPSFSVHPAPLELDAEGRCVWWIGFSGDDWQPILRVQGVVMPVDALVWRYGHGARQPAAA